MARRSSDEKRGPLLAGVGYGLTALTALTLAMAWSVLLRGGELATTVPAFAVTGLLALGAMAVGYLAVKHASGQAGERVLFDTLFPAVAALFMPLVGLVFAVVSAVPLLRGRLGEASISDGSSSTTYDAVSIGRAGRPAGLLLLLLAINQLLVAYAIYRAESAPPDEATARAARLAAYAGSGCAGIADCYSGADHVGPVAGRALLRIDAAGAVTAVDLTMPGAPEPAAACVRGLLAGRRLPDFAEPAGTLTCAWAGSVSGQVQAVQVDGQFVPQAERQ